MSGGEDQLDLTNEELNDKLVEAYQLLEDYDGIDFVVPLGATIYVDSFNNVNTDIALNLARFCARRSILGAFSHGIVCYEPILNPNVATVAERVAVLKTYDWDINYLDDYKTTLNNPQPVLELRAGQLQSMSIRNMLSIIAGPEGVFFQPILGPYVGTLEASYAGRACSLPVHSATTGKRISGPINLYYRYGRGAQNDLVGGRFVVFHENRESVVRTLLDVTYDKEGSTYDNLLTFRTVATIVNDQTSIFEPYIGEAITPANLNSIGSEAQRYLDGVKNIGVIQDFKFNLVVPPTASRMGEIFITQVLVPQSELKRVSVVNKLTNRL
jgi:hypothetical protein